jgi:hypothetical protein
MILFKYIYFEWNFNKRAPIVVQVEHLQGVAEPGVELEAGQHKVVVGFSVPEAGPD